MNKISIVIFNLILLNILTCASIFADSDISTVVGKTSLDASSVAAGTLIGTPIAIVRKTGDQYIGCVKEFKKDSNSYKFWGALYSVPVALVAGPIKGTIIGAKNALHYSEKKPFAKEAFSLGELEVISKASASKNNLHINPDKPESQPWGTPK